ncbi:MAG: hypothetical protein M8364_19225 [Methylobacter sp.]|uniref:hypothetical protein n=1 Tax=Methylobacter sp. TaxID=2051955 RepID=UPI002586C4BA|nr:hypothetical protein [Methylobacter sp.]MCL7423028.1 hypothetical protein [Methylobacter sp.]
MERKVVKQHRKGLKHPGKTDWNKVLLLSGNPKIDEENPELVSKRQFKKASKS